jgi:hypothetical protein
MRTENINGPYTIGTCWIKCALGYESENDPSSRNVGKLDCVGYNPGNSYF